jgi:hypothetical protein
MAPRSHASDSSAALLEFGFDGLFLRDGHHSHAAGREGGRSVDDQRLSSDIAGALIGGEEQRALCTVMSRAHALRRNGFDIRIEHFRLFARPNSSQLLEPHRISDGTGRCAAHNTHTHRTRAHADGEDGQRRSEVSGARPVSAVSVGLLVTEIVAANAVFAPFHSAVPGDGLDRCFGSARVQLQSIAPAHTQTDTNREGGRGSVQCGVVLCAVLCGMLLDVERCGDINNISPVRFHPFGKHRFGHYKCAVRIDVHYGVERVD